METVDFLARLRDLGISLRREGGRLRISAPKGVITDELRTELRRRRDDILMFLNYAPGGPAAAPIARVARDRPLVLSFAQQRLWFLHQLEPGSAEYNMVTAVRLSGPMDVDAMARAISELVGRHEVLRTRFISTAGLPYQVVDPPAPIDLPIVDVTDHPDPTAEASRLVSEDAGRPFDLAAGPPLRVRLLRTSPDEHVLAWTLHHIASDEWSADLLRRELSALYSAFHRAEDSPLPPLPVQYADYAAWQRDRLQGEVLDRQLTYWRRQLADLPVLNLPADRPRPAVRNPARAGTTGFSIPETVVNRLRDLARAVDASMFMTLLAGFQVLLSYHTGLDDLAVGTPVAVRPHADVEDLIGLFINTLVIRVRLADDSTFGETLSQVRQTCLDAFAHRDVPFERLVEELGPVRDRSRHPLFDVVFNFTDASRTADGGRADLHGLCVTDFPVCDTVAKFDLRLDITELADRLEGTLEYSSDLFDAETIGRLVRHFIRLLELVAAAPDTPLSRLDLLDAPERWEVLHGFNPEAPLGDCSPIHEPGGDPAAVAVVAEDRSLSYGELVTQANRLAHHLISIGVKADAVVAVCLDRGTDLIVTIIGILKAGAAYLVIDPSDPLRRQALQLELAASPVIVTTSDLLDRLPDVPAHPICLDHDVPLLAAGPSGPPAIAWHPAKLACLIFTSGSTGTPKGVAITHGNLARYTRAVAERLGIRPGATYAVPYRLTFDFPNTLLYTCLATGGALHLMPSSCATDPDLFSAYLEDHRIDYLKALPSHLRRLASASNGARSLPREALILGGESFPHDWAASLSADTAAVHNHYGPTETTVGATTHRLVPDARVAGATAPIGRPLPHARVYVLDAALRPTPVGVTGEIFIGGAGVTRGYQSRPDLTSERYVPDPFAADGSRIYRTGDAGRWRRDGILEFLGRLDSQLKIRGYRVEPAEIESALCSLPGVRAAVVRTYDPPEEDRLAAFLVPESAVDLPETGSLRQELHRLLPGHLVPATLVWIDALPETPNGKLDRRALPIPDGAATAAGVPPRTPVEQLLAGIFARVLGLQQVGPDDDFFDIGGHSLLAIQVVTRVQTELGIDLPVAVLFDHPTVATLAEAVTHADRAPMPPIVRVSRDEPPVLSFAQRRLWFLHQLEPDSAEYNIATAVRLRGPLRYDHLSTAFSQVVARHEVLRTRFTSVDGLPRQVIDPPAHVELSLVDVSGATDPCAAARRLLSDRAMQPFDLENEPPLRPVMVRLGDDDHVLALTIHHIASDEWSAHILQSELTTLYVALTRDEPAPLSPPSIQYADYAAWQHQWLTGAALDGQLRYWRDQLAGLPVLDLPTDRPRPAVRVPEHADVVEFVVGPELTGRLRELSRGRTTTLFMTGLAAFTALLSIYSRQADIVVGTPIAGRTHPAVEDLIGFFVNTLVVRTRVDQEQSFADLLARVRATCLDAYSHQDLPFERLVEELSPRRERGRHPLFDVMFTLTDGDADYRDGRGEREEDGLAASGLAVDDFSPCEAVAQFDLSLSMAAQGDRLTGRIEYSTDLFTPASAWQMARSLIRLLEAATDTPDRPLNRLELLSASERHRLVEELNPAASPYPDDPIRTLIAANAISTPDKVAVSAGDRSLSYGRLEAHANRLARWLINIGVRRDAPVGVYMLNSPELVVALLGVLKSGGAYLPLDPLYPRERLRHILTTARCTVVITAPGGDDRVPGLASHHLVLDLEDGTGLDVTDPRVDIHPEQLAYVLFTSGSTGMPKGVGISHRSIGNFVAAKTRACAVGPDSRIMHTFSPGFDASISTMLMALSVGATFYPYPAGKPRFGEDVVTMVREQDITSLHLPAPALDTLPPEDLPLLRTISAGGERWPAGLAARWAGARRLLNAYGTTETTIVSSFTRCASTNDEPLTGQVVANTSLHVLDSGLRLVPIGVAGELFIGGAGLARGYVGRPDLTAERFVPDMFTPGGRLYRTGDLARRRHDGTIEILGRLDAQIKIRGYRIEPAEIETALIGCPGVKAATVVRRDQPDGTARLLAYLVPVDGEAPPSLEAVRAAAGAALPEYMIPARFVWLDALPLTPNGKVDVTALPAPTAGPGPGMRQSWPPSGPIEQVVANIFAAALGVERVGTDDNFFERGGHSLLAVHVIARARAAFGIDLPVSAIFECPTVAGLADAIGSAISQGSCNAGDVASSPLVVLNRSTTRPPLLCVHPLSGSPYAYGLLANQIGGERLFVGTRAPGLEDDRAPLDRIEDLAAAYAESVRAVWPRGPYLVGGWSMGALIAQEMARLLHADGERPPILFLIAPGPIAARHSRPRHVLHRLIAAHDGRRMRKAETMSVEELRMITQRSCGPDDPVLLDPAAMRRRLRLSITNRRAMLRYEPRPYNGPTILLLPSEESGRHDSLKEQWRQVCTGGFETHVLPGDHDSMVLARDNAAETARFLVRTADRFLL